MSTGSRSRRTSSRATSPSRGRPAGDGHRRPRSSRDRRQGRPRSRRPRPDSSSAASSRTRSRSHADRRPGDLRPGMTADITITIDSATNVLTVPGDGLARHRRRLHRPRARAPTASRAQAVEVGLVTNTIGRDQERPDRGRDRRHGHQRRPRPATTTTGRWLRRRSRRQRLPGRHGGRRQRGRRERELTVTAPVIRLEHVSRIYDMGRVEGAGPCRRQPRGRPGRVRGHRRAVRLGQVAR